MNGGGISVPTEYRHQLRKERKHLSTTEKNHMLRNFIDSKKGQAITGAQFIEGMDGLTTAPALVAKLVKQGRVKRWNVPNGEIGYHYHYEWINGNVVPNFNPASHNSQPVVISGRTEYATAYELKRIQAWFLDYMEKTEDMDALKEANKFRKFVMNGGETVKPDIKPVEEKNNDEGEE